MFNNCSNSNKFCTRAYSLCASSRSFSASTRPACADAWRSCASFLSCSACLSSAFNASNCPTNWRAFSRVDLASVNWSFNLVDLAVNRFTFIVKARSSAFAFSSAASFACASDFNTSSSCFACSYACFACSLLDATFSYVAFNVANFATRVACLFSLCAFSASSVTFLSSKAFNCTRRTPELSVTCFVTNTKWCSGKKTILCPWNRGFNPSDSSHAPQLSQNWLELSPPSLKRVSYTS